jgi:hypothetical protein
MYYKKYGELPSLAETFDNQENSDKIKAENTFTPILPPPSQSSLSSSSNSTQTSPAPKEPNKNHQSDDVAIDLSITSNDHDISKVKNETFDNEQQTPKPHHPIAKQPVHALNMKTSMSPSSFTSTLNHNPSNTSSFHVPTQKNMSNVIPNDILNSFMNPFLSPLLIQSGLMGSPMHSAQSSPFSNKLHKSLQTFRNHADVSNLKDCYL